MQHGELNWSANCIWSIADDVLRYLYVRGKYRDVILPMTVLRRLDAVLEDSKVVLERRDLLDKADVVEQVPPLRHAAGQAFYNTSPFTLRDLKGKPAPTSNRSAPISKHTSTASRPTCRTSSNASSTTTRSRASLAPMRSVRRSRS